VVSLAPRASSTPSSLTDHPAFSPVVVGARPPFLETQDGGPGSGGHFPLLPAKSPMGRSIRADMGHVGRILIPTQAHPLPCQLACWCVPCPGGAVRDWKLPGLAEMGIDRGETACRKGHREGEPTRMEGSWPASPLPDVFVAVLLGCDGSMARFLTRDDVRPWFAALQLQSRAPPLLPLLHLSAGCMGLFRGPSTMLTRTPRIRTQRLTLDRCAWV
jgi:hypothetical protein